MDCDRFVLARCVLFLLSRLADFGHLQRALFVEQGLPDLWESISVQILAIVHKANYILPVDRQKGEGHATADDNLVAL